MIPKYKSREQYTQVTMMGDRDYRGVVQNAIDSISRELDIPVDADDAKRIRLHEITGCMRRSYYDRTDRMDSESHEFSSLFSGLLRRQQYGCKPKDFAIDGIMLEGRADMIADDIVILFRPHPDTLGDAEIENPHAKDVLYLNACMWIYGKESGIIVYMSGGGHRTETMFSVARNKKMFEETVRRTRVLSNLLDDAKTPILEPSAECSSCQYYERCYTTRRNTKQLSLHEMFGLGGGGSSSNSGKDDGSSK